MQPDTRADDVDHRIDAADFVEMHLLLAHPVHHPFRHGKTIKDCRGLLSDGRRERAALENFEEIMETARRAVFMCMTMLVGVVVWMRMIVMMV